MDRGRNIITLLTVAVIIAIIGFSIWYQFYFDQNCLKSHIHTYTRWDSVCVSRSKSGSCRSSVLVPTEEQEQICDAWRKQ